MAVIGDSTFAHSGITGIIDIAYNRSNSTVIILDNSITGMSRVGRCIDNGPMEGFWGILKVEMYYPHRFNDYESLKKAIEDYIWYYNNNRFQEKLHCLAPIEFRQILMNAA